MFTRIFTAIVASSLFLAASAAPFPGESSGVSQCNAGTVQCCNQYQDAKTVHEGSLTAQLLSLLDVNLDGVEGLIGSSCSPVGALGGSACSTQQVCCQNNQFNGLVVVGCTPINVFV